MAQRWVLTRAVGPCPEWQQGQQQHSDPGDAMWWAGEEAQVTKLQRGHDSSHSQQDWVPPPPGSGQDSQQGGPCLPAERTWEGLTWEELVSLGQWRHEGGVKEKGCLGHLTGKPVPLAPSRPVDSAKSISSVPFIPPQHSVPLCHGPLYSLYSLKVEAGPPRGEVGNLDRDD